jgi:lysophospholipase L1-like esterase
MAKRPPRTRTPKPHSKLKNALFRVAAVVLALLVCEIAFRLFAGPPTPRLCKSFGETHFWCSPAKHLTRHEGWFSAPANTTYQHIYPDDPRQYFSPSRTVEYHVNDLGFRGSSLSEDRGGRHRVLFVGDSFTFGEGVHEQDTFVARLSKLLEQRVADGNGVQLINLGQPGHNPANELKILEQLAPQSNAELVVLVLTPNDWPSQYIAEMHGVEVRGQYTALYQPNPLYHASRMLWWFDAQWRNYRLNRALEAAFDDVPQVLATDVQSREKACRTILEIRDVARRQGAEFTAVVLPELLRLEADRYPYAFIHESVVALGRQEGFPVVDLQPDFIGRDPEELWVHRVDHHPNDQAHRIIAERLARDLAASFLIPPTP